jgi:hypothetical protein
MMSLSSREVQRKRPKSPRPIGLSHRQKQYPPKGSQARASPPRITSRCPASAHCMQWALCRQRAPRVDFRRGPLGPGGVCWSRRAYRMWRGKGPASALCCAKTHCLSKTRMFSNRCRSSWFPRSGFWRAYEQRVRQVRGSLGRGQFPAWEQYTSFRSPR